MSKRLLILATAAVMAAGSAQAGFLPPPPTPVPEIDITSGMAALAAIIGAVALFWERRRRA